MKIIINGEEAEVGGGGVSEERAKEIAEEAAAGKLDKTGGALEGSSKFSLVVGDEEAKFDTAALKATDSYITLQVVMRDPDGEEVVEYSSLLCQQGWLSVESSTDMKLVSPVIHLENEEDVTCILISEGTVYLYKCAEPSSDTMPATKKYVDKHYVTVGLRTGSTAGAFATAEGRNVTADGMYSHAEGESTNAHGQAAHAEGSKTSANWNGSHAEGGESIAEGDYSHAEGHGTVASGQNSHAEGESTTASGTNSHAGGETTIAASRCQTAIGRLNVQYGSTGNSIDTTAMFIVGKGSSNAARANCFRVGYTGVWATGNYSSSGADYAELFEWADGNPAAEDRVGRFVTLDGEKIRIAGPEDAFVLGIISGNPSVVGDVHDDQWAGMYLYDIYGRPLWEDVEVPAETVEEPDPENPEQTITRELIPAHMEHRQKLNPDYDGTQKYIPRTDRPEWGCVGMMGKLVVWDDGSCVPNGWCTVGDGGIAVASAERTRYRCLSRVDERHVRILIL